MGNLDIPRDLLLGWVVVVIDDEEDSLMVAEIILREYGANLIRLLMARKVWILSGKSARVL